MNLFKRFAAVAVCLSALLLPAETIDLNVPEFWSPAGKCVKSPDGSLRVSGQVMLASKEKITVDPAKKYTLSMEVRCDRGKDWVLAGFMPYAASGQAIGSQNANAVSGTMTETVSPAEKGSKVLVVKDASAWKPLAWYSVVSGAKEDFSDLPNFKVLSNGIEKVEKTGDTWTVSLKQGIPSALPAGTALRVHVQGGYLYTAGASILKPGVCTPFTGSIQGVKQAPGYKFNEWPAGTGAAQVVLLLDWSNLPDVVTEIRNAKLTIE